MTTTLATIPCAHDGCDRPAVWHFFSLAAGDLVASTCPKHFDDPQPSRDFRAIHTKDALEIVNRMNREA